MIRLLSLFALVLTFSCTKGPLDFNGQSEATSSESSPIPEASFEIIGQNVTENTGNVFVVVLLSKAATKELSLPYVVINGTASGADHDFESGILTFQPGEKRKVISGNIVNDTLKESNETFALKLIAAPGVKVKASHETHTIQIIDDETANISLNNSSAVEGNSLTFTVTLSLAVNEQVTVDYATVSDTAVAGTHFTSTSGTLTFNAGETSKTITVITSANTAEYCALDRRFTLKLSNVTGGANLAVASVTGTITDPDVPTLSISDASGNEGDAVKFTAALNGACHSRDIEFSWATSSGTATSGTDFTAVTSTATIPAGDTSVTLSVSTIDDAVFEGDETFSVTISSPTDATLGTATATGTIVDDEEEPTVQFKLSSKSVNEDAGDVSVVVELSHATTRTVTVPFSISGSATATGNARDFDIDSSPLTIAAGSTSGTITVSILDDNAGEGDETIILTMGTVTNATKSGNTTHTLTILANDPPAAPNSLSLINPTSSPSDVTTPTIRVGGVVSGHVVQLFTDSDCSDEVASGTATGTTIDLTTSALAENNYSFYAKASDSYGNTSSCSSAKVDLLIDSVISTIAFTSSSNRLQEADANHSLVVTADVPKPYNRTLKFHTTNSTATNSVHYDSLTTTVVLPANQTSVTVPFATLENNDADGESHVCAIKASDDKLQCWGDSSFGQFGNGESLMTPFLRPDF